MDVASGTIVPPDGGWGWVVVAAVALINMTNQSILSVFGLLFGAQLRDMQQETFTAALITNLNSLALNFSGLFIGPAIKSFKPRNVAICGCVMVSFGLSLCAFATEGWHFIVGYSLFVGLGLGLIAPSTFMAINSYFTTKRGRAVGVSLAGAGLGQVFIPHIVRFFLDNYGFRVAVLAMSMLSLIGLIGALLLKPLTPSKTESNTTHNNRKHFTIIPRSTVGADKAKVQREDSVMEIKIVNNEPEMDKQKSQEVSLLPRQNNVEIYKATTLPLEKTARTTSCCGSDSLLCRKLCQRVIEAMDLELLKDPIFLSIIIGMALVYTSTINFTMIFPSFLQDSVGYTTKTTATCMSIMAGADIICRLLLPCITDKLKIPYRVIFLLGTVGLLISRAALAESVDLTSIIVMSIFTGMTKSATVLNNNLTISGHCKPEKLPGGLGLNMIAKGVLVISVGQLLGWVRDFTKSYVLCLHAQNALLLFVICVWTPEMFYRYRLYLKEKRLQRLQEGEETHTNVQSSQPLSSDIEAEAEQQSLNTPPTIATTTITKPKQIDC
ncbi:monocarboxylate transporter 9 [Musca domestica]|uniref:Monocarboxylate transporter 9 n=1 Tax=Musca domestica TaxID=7370 RepID=A0ABM3URF3_MUSDO|nr:monocarboxylate transporter 9 [Musca domestica]XP_005179501.2 monocarboxylate transporter 9 [Musca domestica]XP_058976087.1 monocarboxylate transporter 9 [Musca domestica]